MARAVMKDGKRRWITLAASKSVAKRISAKRRGDLALQAAGISADAPVYLQAAHVQEFLAHAMRAAIRQLLTEWTERP